MNANGVLFGAILCDPPWSSVQPTQSRDNGGSWYYNKIVLSPAELAMIQLPAMGDSLLFLWSPAANTSIAVDLMAKWGFRYKTNIAWVKVAKSGQPIMGLGQLVRHAHELLHIGMRGRVLVQDRTIRSVVVTPPNKVACSKPEVVYDIIERMVGGPYLELFARTRRAGWFACGDELEGGSDLLFPEWELIRAKRMATQLHREARANGLG